MENRTDNAEPTLARRYDFVGEPLSVVRRDDGSLLLTAVAVREGVLEYPQPDGSVRRELVNLAAVEATANTIGRRPMTLDHPEGGFVNLDNAGELRTGTVGERPKIIALENDVEGGYCTVTTVIWRKDAVQAYDAGKRGVSCGYPLLDLLETPGVSKRHGRYDAIQVRGPTNHLAQCDAPRVEGAYFNADASYIRADSTDAAGTYAPPKPAGTPRNDRGPSMNSLLIALCAKMGVRHDSEDAALTALDAAVLKLKADNEELQEKVDKFPEEVEKEDAPDLVEELKVAKARIAELEAAAAKKDEEEEEMKADARLKTLQTLATEHDVKHDGLDLPALRLKLALTRSDSFTAETPVVALDAVIATIPAEKPGRSDARGRYEQGKGSDNRADDADGKRTRADSADEDNDFHDPTLERADKAYAGGDK